MRRRSGFTLVEVLVALALILFIMTILASAFSEATQIVSDLKSAGDLAERLRGTATVIHRDLEAPHCFNSSGAPLPISTIFGTSASLSNPPPGQGFFRIYEQNAGHDEGADVNGIHSYYQTTASLAYTITLNGTRRDDFLSAFVPGSPLTSDPVLGPPDQRYQDTAGAYNSPSAEVALFLVPSGDVTDVSGTGALPLFGLYRRQLLIVPPTVPSLGPTTYPAVSNSSAPLNYVEISTVPTVGEAPSTPNLNYNRLADLTMPVRRFWMNRAAAQGAYQPGAPGGGYATMGYCNPQYQAADLLMPDVVSMDVRVLILGDSDFRDLNDSQVQAFSNNNPAFTQLNGPRAFDTWSSQTDALSGANYANWTTPGATSIPLYKNAAGTPIMIQAIQNLAAGLGFQDEEDPSGDDRAADVSARRSQRPPPSCKRQRR